MNRKQFLCSLAGAGLAGAAAADSGAENGPLWPLTVTILPAEIRSYVDVKIPTRHLKISLSAPRLYVALQNISSQPIKIWNENNSWGSGNLTLEISAVNGKFLAKPLRVQRNVDVWLANMATYSMLAPGDMIAREVTLEPPKDYSGARKQFKWPYKGFPLTDMNAPSVDDFFHTIRMRAVFEVTPDVWSKQEGVWTGRVTSSEYDYAVLMTEHE